jgi:hypothetical protein
MAYRILAPLNQVYLYDADFYTEHKQTIKYVVALVRRIGYVIYSYLYISDPLLYSAVKQ